MRVFLGIPIKKEIAEKIHKDFSFLSKYSKLVPPENMHITLNFLGEVEEVESIKEKMDRALIPSFNLKLKGIGVFPSLSFIRVVYIKAIANEFIEKELKDFSSSLGGEPFSTLHLTVARVKRKPPIDFLSKPYDYGELKVNEIILYQSILKKPSPEYKKLYVKRLE